MEKYLVSERLPAAGQIVNVKAGIAMECCAEFDGVDFIGPKGPFLPGAVTEWWPQSGDGNGKALEYRAIIEKEQELAALRERIAYDAARTEIEINCLSKANGWWDTQDVPSDDAEWISDRVRYLYLLGNAEWLSDRVRYLDLLGKLERRQDAPHIVRILELEAE